MFMLPSQRTRHMKSEHPELYLNTSAGKMNRSKKNGVTGIKHDREGLRPRTAPPSAMADKCVTFTTASVGHGVLREPRNDIESAHEDEEDADNDGQEADGNDDVSQLSEASSPRGSCAFSLTRSILSAANSVVSTKPTEDLSFSFNPESVRSSWRHSHGAPLLQSTVMRHVTSPDAQGSFSWHTNRSASVSCESESEIWATSSADIPWYDVYRRWILPESEA
jgi:hypothetical protein